MEADSATADNKQEEEFHQGRQRDIALRDGKREQETKDDVLATTVKRTRTALPTARGKGLNCVAGKMRQRE